MHNHESPAAVMQQAVEALKAGNLALAQVLAWICIEQEPEHADAYNLLGVIACQLKLFEQGVRFLERALQISPDHKSAKSNYNRGRTELSVHAATTVRGGADDANPVSELTSQLDHSMGPVTLCHHRVRGVLHFEACVVQEPLRVLI